MTERPPLFEPHGEVGAGATGRVLRGVLLEAHGAFAAGTEVAVKRLHPELREDPRALATFRTEAEAAAAARDPGLVRVLHAGESAEGPYLVMEFIPGDTLRQALQRSGPLPEPLLRSVAVQVAGGLAAMHAAGWVHADVKPENMRLDAAGRAVLLDLGFALRVVEPPAPAATGLDGSHVNPGSLAYLAPERARGEPPTPKSDVFSLGLTLYELAAGLHPLADLPGENGAGLASSGFSSGIPLRRSLETPGGDLLLAALATARFPPPSRFVPQLSPFFDHLVLEMLARDPARRPTSAEVHVRLQQAEGGAWWRDQLEVAGSTRRGVMGDPLAHHLTPLVGREQELEQLLSTWSALEQTRPAPGAPAAGRAVWLLGPEGSGKSRLMSDFAARVRQSPRPPVYLYGRCSSLEIQRPCAAILRLLERYLRLPTGTAPGGREREILARSVPPTTASTLFHALAGDLDTTTEGAVPVALTRWLVALSRSTPLVVFLDDVNFADDGTLVVLLQLVEELQGTPLLLVLGEREYDQTAHPQALELLRSRLLARDCCLRMHLGPLDEKAVADLAATLFHHSAPLRRIGHVLWSRSRGNPGLLAELLRDLIDRGQARPHAGHGSKLVLDSAPEDLPLPQSLGTLIQGRFRMLAALERRWLQRLSVVGGRIDRDFLLRAFPTATAPELDQVLTRLVTTGWIVPAGDRFRFARPALREAIYGSMSEKSRLRYHALAARALAPPPSEEPGAAARMSLESALQRAFHLRSAGEHAALLRILSPLVQALLRRGQPQRVHTLARWGLDALDASRKTRARERQRIEFLEAAADAADRLGYRADQRQWLDRLSDMELDAQADPASLARVYLLHGRYAVSTGQYGLARGMLKNAVELAERSGGDELTSESLRRLAAVQAHVGELPEARQLADRALEKAVHGPQEAVAWLQLGVVDLLEDDIEGALRSVDRALALLRKATGWDLPGVFAAAHMLRGRIYRLAGRPRRALGSLSHAVRLARQSGERRLEMEATARLGGLLLDVDQSAAAEARLREALLIAGEIEDRRGQTLAGLWLGILLWENDDLEARPLLERVRRLAGEMGLGRAEALTLSILARIHRAADELPRALERSAEALALLERHGAELADRIVIAGTRALILHGAGEEETAADLVRELRRRLRRENERVENDVLRRRHRVASTRLLEAVLNPEGVMYPRVRAYVGPSGPT